MVSIERHDLQQLVKSRRGPCISIYIPIDCAGSEEEQNRIRLKNLLKEAKNLLEKENLRKKQIDYILEFGIDILNDSKLWKNREPGMALFLSLEYNDVYLLPKKFKESVSISNRFQVRQLLHIITRNYNYNVLTLSQSNVSLYHASEIDLEEITLKDIPTGIDEFLKYEDPEQQIQGHVAGSAGKQRSEMIYHGHGGDSEEKKKNEILRFFQHIDKNITGILRTSNLPLILFGQEHLNALYRKANSYSGLSEIEVRKNPEDYSHDELHNLTYEAVKPDVEKKLRQDMETFNKLKGTGKAVNELQHSIIAAMANRVSILFVQKGKKVFGKYDANRHEVDFQPEDDQDNVDLIDEASIRTYLSGGNVHFLDKKEMPEESILAAVLRY